MESELLELKNNLKNCIDLYHSIIKTGKNNYRDLEIDIVSFLNSDDENLRMAAIRVLGLYWKVPEYKSHAWKMFLSEKDEEVRAVALMVWASYYTKTNNKSILEILHKIMLDEQNHWMIRDQAYRSILKISMIPQKDWPRKEIDWKNFKKELDWKLLNKIL